MNEQTNFVRLCLTFRCPRCSARPGRPCKTGSLRIAKEPHKERRDKAQQKMSGDYDFGAKTYIEDILECLQSLDSSELRRLAWEALLLSDGPNHIEDNEQDGPVIVKWHNEQFSLTTTEGEKAEAANAYENNLMHHRLVASQGRLLHEEIRSLGDPISPYIPCPQGAVYIRAVGQLWRGAWRHEARISPNDWQIVAEGLGDEEVTDLYYNGATDCM